MSVSKKIAIRAMFAASIVRSISVSAVYCKLLLLNKQGRKSGFSFRQISNGLIVDLKTHSASAYHSTFVTLIFFPLSKVQYTVVVYQWPPGGGRDALGM